MSIKKFLLVSIIALLAFPVFSKDYEASFFGIKPGGKTLNTKSIQFAIDYISTNGGGRLVFNVGNYLTGTIYLKSGVTLQLNEGSVLLGSLNPFDYQRNGFTAMIFAIDQHNIGLTGNGKLDGQGKYVARNVVTNIEKKLITDSYLYGRPSAEIRPMLVNFIRCKDVKIQGITFENSACWTQTYDQCTRLDIDNITVNCTSYWNQDGLDIVDCHDVTVTNSFIDAADDGICLKSHDATKICKNILIRNNKIRSSANGIKFGTASYGGFEKIKIIDNIVFNTYRSAVALEAVDGGYIEDIEIDSLQSLNTGNVIFLRTGERVKGKKSRLTNVSISNVIADIPSSKADAGYGYEGPEEDQPRNISPAIIITGLANAEISDIFLKNIEITHPGGGKKEYANVPLDKLTMIPEIPAKYPDFSMFKELPSWGIFARHANGLHFSNVTMVCSNKDFRLPVVLDDVSQSTFSDLKVVQEGVKKTIYQNNSKEIVVK
jgi:hypothetical protein